MCVCIYICIYMIIYKLGINETLHFCADHQEKKDNPWNIRKYFKITYLIRNLDPEYMSSSYSLIIK